MPNPQDTESLLNKHVCFLQRTLPPSTLALSCYCPQEVVDLRHQVTGRLRGVAQGWDLDKLILSFDTWRQWALLKHLKRLAMERWVMKQKARCVLAHHAQARTAR